ncbi:MAG: Rid family hydrolase [Ignavibacteria bacterium]|jgi:enamine deaminase RidA (YjgF/YER057c/UK114 family)
MKVKSSLTDYSLHIKSKIIDNRKVYWNKSFIIYESVIGRNQVDLVASVKDKSADSIGVCRDIYSQIADIIKQTEIQIIQEKVFGSTCIHEDIFKAREDILRGCGIYEELPVTYIQGEPFWGEGFAGIQICAIKTSTSPAKVWTIYEDGIPSGRGIDLDGATFFLMQNMHGLKQCSSGINSRADQTAGMFERTDTLLRKYGAVYRDVVCTRIYISDILDWYDEFNKVRNEKYREFGILPSNSADLVTEQIYLPSSTGIRADNPEGAAAIMNVLAAVKVADSKIEIKHDNGIKQRSAYRYGSAFSRSTIISGPNVKCILLSGTAAIDEQGKSLFPGNAREQMRKTLEIVGALLGKEGALLKDICHATVFLKRREDILIYEEVANEYGIVNMPAVCVIADVCRDELLFELDAIAAVENTD